MRRRVVITGLGAVTPVGIGVEPFWQSLVGGRSGIAPIEAFDVSGYPTRFAGEVRDFDALQFMERKVAKRMDRYCQFAVAASRIALEDSKLDVGARSERVGVILGTGIGGTWTWEQQHSVLRDKGPHRVSPFFIPMLISDMASGQVAIMFGARGPNLAVVGACATSTHAIGDAYEIIRRGDADAMIAGGSEAAVTPLGLAGFCAMRALSTRNDDPQRASRPFDKERDGFVMAEGAGAVVLEAEEGARERGARIYCEVIGYGLTADAYHVTAPAPAGEGGARAMATAIRKAGIQPREVDYINAHGTSTQLNDKLETDGIKSCFGDAAREIPISSTKSMTGHLLGAAGAVEAIVCALTITRGVVHPTINYQHPDPECDLDYVPNQAREADVKIALSASFGFGGHNAALLFRA
ncbi:MAG: beta-ketoacyl-ACP synthase II [Armatimonadota bacterium]|nr:MAG: beta-ketoacyl-ACP synthase II [Armatimonadota bacterium]